MATCGTQARTGPCEDTVATTSEGEEILLVPKEIAEFSLGFVVDAGSSVTKLIYRSKKDYENGRLKEEVSTHGKLRLRYFPEGANDEVLQFIEGNCDILESSKYNRSKDGPVWLQTGVYTQHFKTAMDGRFQIKTKLSSEIIAMSKAVEVCRSILKWKCFPPSVNAATFGLKFVRSMLATIQIWKEIGDNSFDDMLKHEDRPSLQNHMTKMMTADGESLADELGKQEIEFPCLINLCGSDSGYMIMNEDGTYKLTSFNTMSGKSFLGLGKALTGAKHFEELIAMASRGDNKNVDIMTEELKNEDHKEEDWYSAMPNDHVVFSLGKLTAGDEQNDVPYSKDDIAAGLLHLHCMTLAKVALLNARLHKAKSVILCGSFVNTPFARETMEKYFLADAMMQVFEGEEQVKIHFLPYPGYICGLGVWLQNLEIEEQHRTQTI